jgi:hypothetical protein
VRRFASTRRRRWLLAAAAALALLWVMLVSAEPAVEALGPATTQQVAAGRSALRAVREAQDRPGGAGEVRWDNRALAGLSRLAADAGGLQRARARVEGGALVGAASVRAPIWGWINLRFGTSGTHAGFPALEGSVGRIPVPSWAIRAAAELGRWLVRFRGADLPPLDMMIPGFEVEPEAVRFRLGLAKQSGIVRGLIGARGKPVEGQEVAAAYCRLVALNRREPSGSLAVHVGRAFGGTGGEAERNRAALVALAMLAVGDRADDLGGAAAAEARKCGSVGRVSLGGRADLAKHWTLSAALTAVIGTDSAGAMGEWKELSDSLGGGSGFSFLDLAADRSGLQAAQRAGDPDTAAAEARRLARVTDAELLPVALMAAQEGLTEQQFLQRYRGIDAAKYRDTVAWIDRELERARATAPD